MHKVTDPEVLTILQSMRFEGNVGFLTCGEIPDKKLYQKVDKVLKSLQGKWNRSKGGHLFPGDAKATLATILDSGTFHDLKRDDNLFETPPLLVETLIERACITPGMLALEPSAGRGAIVKALVAEGAIVHAVEKNEAHKTALVESGAAEVIIKDFLDHEPTAVKYDVIVMNPPFANGKKVADIAHVRMAFDHLKPGGRLVAIMSPGFTFKKDANSVLFRQFVDEVGEYDENPDGAFKQQGTNVRTVTVVLRNSAA